MSLFHCPLCQAPLTRAEHARTCPAGHSFDLAAAGYTHLLPANRKHSKNPGDDKAMVAARSAFLDKGYYAPLANALCDLAARDTAELPHPALLDCGCGEGYYTAALAARLAQEGRSGLIAGVDISKFALRRAAKRVRRESLPWPRCTTCRWMTRAWICSSTSSLPCAPRSLPGCSGPAGTSYYVVPSALHLWEMKQVLYDKPYENAVKREDYPGFQWLEAVPLRYPVHLDCSQDIMALFGMTPYAWKTPKAGVERLSAREELDTQIGFDIHVYRKL